MERFEKSACYRVKNSYEICIYLWREPKNLWWLDNNNKLIRNLILDSNNLLEIIPTGYFQASKRNGEFIFVSCCVAPGFDFKDFELLSNTNHATRLDKAINDII